MIVILCIAFVVYVVVEGKLHGAQEELNMAAGDLFAKHSDQIAKNVDRLRELAKLSGVEYKD